MYNKTIEKLLPVAIEVFRKYEGGFTKETNGYFASYGPSIIMAGLKQSVIFYEKKASYVNKIIWDILNHQDIQWGSDAPSLKEMVIASDNRKDKKHILDTIVACKLVIRTYDLKD